MHVTLRAPCSLDLEVIATRMRPIDRLECLCIADQRPREALETSVANSAWSLVALADDEVACVFGVAPGSLLGRTGHPWLLAVTGFERWARPFLTHSHAIIARMHADFPVLTNVIHAENAASIRWLKWCGFEFGRDIEVSGEPFREFSKCASQ